MRTTVTLDPDVRLLVDRETRRTGLSFKEVLNEALRSSLRPKGERPPALLPPRPMGLRRGIDPRRLSELADEGEADHHLALGARRRTAPVR